MNGVDKNVTESMLSKEGGDIASEKPIAKARPRQKPTVTLTSVSTLVRERKWIDIETQRSHDQKCFDVSEAITRLLQQDQTVHREIDGAIQYNDIIEECRKKKFGGSSQRSLEDWISNLATGGGAKIRIQPCLKQNSSNKFLFFRSIQGHSGDNGNVFWCNLKLAQERGSHFYQTRSHAVVLYNTLPTACIEKAVCMKIQEELYQKVRLTSRLPRVELKSNSQSGQQDQPDQEARSSWETSSDSKSFGETWNNAVDYKIPGIPLSTAGYNT